MKSLVEFYGLKVDLQDNNLPLTFRAVVAMAVNGKCNCDDFLCSDLDLAVAMREIEGNDVH